MVAHINSYSNIIIQRKNLLHAALAALAGDHRRRRRELEFEFQVTEALIGGPKGPECGGNGPCYEFG